MKFLWCDVEEEKETKNANSSVEWQLCAKMGVKEFLCLKIIFQQNCLNFDFKN
jgi:hypothetical protein